MESGTDFYPWIRKNQGPSGMPKKSGFKHLIYLPYFIVVIGYVQTNLVPLIEVYIQEHQYFASVSVILVFHCGFYLLLCVYLPCLEWNQIRRAVIFICAAVIIVMIYATLVVVNTRYVSLVMVPIIMLVFIGALRRKVSLRGNLKQDDSGSSEAEIAGDGSAEKADGNCGSADKEEVMVAIALLPYLCIIRGAILFWQLSGLPVPSLPQLYAWGAHSDGRVAVIFPFSAGFGGSSKGFPRGGAPDSAHHGTGAARREDVVLVCTPEIVAALLWFTSHLGHGGTTIITVDKVTSPQSGVVCLSVVMAILSYLARSIIDESNKGEDLFVRYRTAVIACAVSGILLSLCAFALRQWPGETKATPSSELEGAIRLFNFWRNVMSIAAALLLIVWPLVDVQLGSQVQGLLADSVGKFLDV